jgi:hypothetical protein
MQLHARLANDLDSVLRRGIVEDCEWAAVGGATSHGGSASEIVVNRGPVVKIQPVHLFSIYDSVIV